MTDSMVHRGPDSRGIWVDADAGIGLGHRRLAVVDLTETGHQPMVSPSGRFVIAFNGEIYNHLEVRRHLSSNWRGSSDTETLLAGFDELGIARTLGLSVGMFAIGVWDRQRSELTLARDRLGEKPLYYGRLNSAGADFIFASDLAAITANSRFSGELDQEALALYLTLGYVPCPWSIYAGVQKLPPGHLATYSRATGRLTSSPYWSLADALQRARQSKFIGTIDEAAEALEGRLKTAVRGQLLSDVPLGAFLSGGIDSTTIVAIMQSISSDPIKTFTIGNEVKEYDEARSARQVADFLGTEHTELYVSSSDALAVIPELPASYSEPFADSSQIPTILVSRLARRRVTVALSGDGADELFGGYNRHRFVQNEWPRLTRVPAPIRRLCSRPLLAASTATLDRLGSALGIGRRYTAFGDKVHKAASILGAVSVDELHFKLMSSGVPIQASVPSIGGPEFASSSAFERVLATDAKYYLPDDILTKVDRASMSVSLEVRAPYLDHRVVEFAWQLPASFKVSGGTTKAVLRKVLDRFVPRDLVDRPKSGFSIPIMDWLRGPLRDWSEDLLTPQQLQTSGLLDIAQVRQMWAQHLSGLRNHSESLWTVLMLQAWLQRGFRP